MNVPFLTAQPVWIRDREREMNQVAGFRAVIASEPGVPVRLRIACSSTYRAWLDGEFVAAGPARAPHGFFRLDDLDLTPRLAPPGKHLLAVEVGAPNVNSYATLDQPAFLQAEVLAAERVLAATGAAENGFSGRILTHRVRRVPKFTSQRTFMEVYRPGPDDDAWRNRADAPFAGEPLARQPGGEWLARHSPVPLFACHAPTRMLATMRLRRDDRRPIERNPWIFAQPDVPVVKGWKESEIEANPWTEVQRLAVADRENGDRPWPPAESPVLAGPASVLLDFGRELTGAIGLEVVCRKPSAIRLVFDEVLVDGSLSRTRHQSGCVAAWDLPAGRHRIETAEPYALRFLETIVADGEAEVARVWLRAHENPLANRLRFDCDDPRLVRILEAARATFAQNATDVFMDCPGRERAGWLCDSFFTARVEWLFTGGAGVERDFLENFALPASFDPLPAGMLPMVWPADLFGGRRYIPNWALFFVLQLEEYKTRGGDSALVERLRSRVLDLLAFFDRYRNADGLLERLDNWVFVEWSEANRLVQDVNHPSNMLYAAALDAAGRLYASEALSARAAAVREALRRTAWDGAWFCDNAVRRDGKLVLSGERTEVCQYYAFWTDTASPETHPDLWRIVAEELGPRRRGTGRHPAIHPANVFIGYYLRLELLSRFGRADLIRDELVDLFLPMAEATGTLWEHDQPRASCNHGFASHAAAVILRDLAGIASVDHPNRQLHLRLDPRVPLARCEVGLPLGEHVARIAWRRDGNRLLRDTVLPPGWSAVVADG